MSPKGVCCGMLRQMNYVIIIRYHHNASLSEAELYFPHTAALQRVSALLKGADGHRA